MIPSFHKDAQRDSGDAGVVEWERCMRILIVTPAPAGSRLGNRVTALRWARLLRQAGHRVTVRERFDRQVCDVFIALHARKSAAAIEGFHAAYPHQPIVLALTGTDLYQDLPTSADAQRALERATRCIVLQELALAELPAPARAKTRVIYQSVTVPRRIPRKPRDVFRVCVLGHLRDVKDPLRTAAAARLLPASSRVQVLHIGAALSNAMRDAAEAEMRANPRYRWIGEVSRTTALRQLGASHVLSLTSIHEGGANVVSEACVLGVPVITSRIPGSLGLLGADYPGIFAVGDTQELAVLLERIEHDAPFLSELTKRSVARAPLFAPERELRALAELLRELPASRGTGGRTRVDES
ncbi:MAG: selenoneine biosynthesis selenosugar synthase SenB [Planctomycetota bacterium]